MKVESKEESQKTSSVKGLVKAMRAIRDEINAEISDMSFLEQRAYLDKLLKKG